MRAAMRAVLAGTCESTVLLMAAFVLVAVGPAKASETRYRILFTGHGSDPVSTGEGGMHNVAEVRRIMSAMRRVSPLGTVRFVFVASRAGICGPQCAPEHLMWQRVNAATTALRAEAARTGTQLPFQLTSWSFLEELPAGTALPPAGDSRPGIDLRLHLEAPRPGPCPWRILVYDQTLPPVLGAPDGEPALPVPDGKSIAVGQGARIAIQLPKAGAAEPLAVWQDARGSAWKVDAAAFAAVGTALPVEAVRLLMLDARDAEARVLSARLSDGTRDYAASDGTRGFDDHVGQAPRQLQPPTEATSSSCEVAFTTASD